MSGAPHKGKGAHGILGITPLEGDSEGEVLTVKLIGKGESHGALVEGCGDNECIAARCKAGKEKLPGFIDHGPGYRVCFPDAFHDLRIIVIRGPVQKDRGIGDEVAANRARYIDACA